MTGSCAARKQIIEIEEEKKEEYLKYLALENRRIDVK